VFEGLKGRAGTVTNSEKVLNISKKLSAF